MTCMYSALKLKTGEIEALLESERLVVDSIVPIFDVARPSSKTSIEKRLESSLSLIRKAWPKQSKEFYLDLRDLPLELRLANGIHPAYRLASDLVYHGSKVTLCFGFDRDSPYEDAISNVVLRSPITNVALRLQLPDLKLLDDTVDKSRGFLGRVGRTFETSTVFLDLECIDGATDDLSAIVERAYIRFRKLGVTRIVLLATGMWDWSKLQSRTITRVPREEIKLWEQLRKKGIAVSYGDYGVISPSFIDPEFRFNSPPTPKLRYATMNHWLIAKGEKPQKGENSQYPGLAQSLMSNSEFRQNDLDWGHDRIRDLASYDVRTIGSARAVAIGTSIHLDITAKNIAYLERQFAGDAGLVEML